jgi:transcription initiation factor IIE alpha subunit
VHSNTEVSILLACGHLISENANTRIIQENRNKRKFKCPICQKEIRVEDSINAKF